MADEVKSDPIEVKATPATVGVSSDEPKQGKICCGFCCDFRRAVMVLAIVGIVFQAITLVLSLLGTTGLSIAAASVDDDAAQDELAGAAVVTGIYTAAVVLALCFYIFQLFAALKYNVCMLATVVIYELVYLGITLWNTYDESVEADTGFVGPAIGAIIVQAIFIYPVVGLIMEIKSGIMSAETYPREAHSCCCEPKV